MYISHMRSEGNRLLEAVDELITIAREAGRAGRDLPPQGGGCRRTGRRWTQVIAKVEAARAEGLAITADMYTYTAGATGLDAAMPPWVQEGGLRAWMRRLKDPAIRGASPREMRTPTDEWENLYLLAGSPDGSSSSAFKKDSLKYLTGQDAGRGGRAARHLAGGDRDGPRRSQDDSRVGTVYFLMSEENVKKQIALPWVSFDSDADSLAPEGVFLKSNPHPRAYGNFARLLGKYVREEQVHPARGGHPPPDVAAGQQPARSGDAAPSRRLLRRPRVFDPATINDHATFDGAAPVRDRHGARVRERRPGAARRRAHRRHARARRARSGLGRVGLGAHLAVRATREGLAIFLIAATALTGGCGPTAEPAPVAEQQVAAAVDTMSPRDAALDIIATARFATLVTIGPDGHPQARVVDPFAPDSAFVVRVATNALSRKVAEIAADSRVTLLYFDVAGNSYVTLVGTAELVRDDAERARWWKEDWASFYQDRNMGEDYMLIRIRPTRLEVSSERHGISNDAVTWRPVLVPVP